MNWYVVLQCPKFNNSALFVLGLWTKKDDDDYKFIFKHPWRSVWERKFNGCLL